SLNQIANAARLSIRSSGLLDLNGHADTVGPITLDSGKITTRDSGLLRLAADVTAFASTFLKPHPSIMGHIDLGGATRKFDISNDFLFCDATISGSGGITKAGAGSLGLESSNSYTGLSLVAEGELAVFDPHALGSTNSGTVVSSGATLFIFGGFAITNEALTLNGAGFPGSNGALESDTLSTNLWVGPITLGSDSTFNIFLGTLRLIGPISGPGGLTLIGGGTNYFEGSTSNSYAGVTRVLRGTTLLLKKTAFDGAIPGNLIIGDDSSPANSDLVHGLDDHQIAGNAAVTVSSSGLLDLSSTHESIGALSGLGHVMIGDLDVGADNSSSVFA